MRIQTLRHGLVIVTGCALLAACNGDRSPLAPSSSRPAGPALTIVASGTTTQAGDTLVTTFTVSNGDTTNVRLFNNLATVTFTPNSICQLGSTYGPGEWDQPCTPSVTPVTVVARGWLDANGQPRVDFQPRMRFNPAASPVMLSLNDSKKLGSAMHINYCTDFGSCYDESLFDASLSTSYDGYNQRYVRRVKHFSGYNIASGYAE